MNVNFLSRLQCYVLKFRVSGPVSRTTATALNGLPPKYGAQVYHNLDMAAERKNKRRLGKVDKIRKLNEKLGKAKNTFVRER